MFEKIFCKHTMHKLIIINQFHTFLIKKIIAVIYFIYFIERNIILAMKIHVRMNTFQCIAKIYTHELNSLNRIKEIIFPFLMAEKKEINKTIWLMWSVKTKFDAWTKKSHLHIFFGDAFHLLIWKSVRNNARHIKQRKYKCCNVALTLWRPNPFFLSVIAIKLKRGSYSLPTHRRGTHSKIWCSVFN